MIGETYVVSTTLFFKPMTLDYGFELWNIDVEVEQQMTMVGDERFKQGSLCIFYREIWL